MKRSLHSWIELGHFVSRVAVFGDICIDHYPALNLQFIGGCSFNVTSGLKSLGTNSTLISVIGEDEYTEQIEQKILSLGIESILSRVPLRNQKIDILLKKNGERVFSNYEGEILNHHPHFDLEDFDFVLSPYFKEIQEMIENSLEDYQGKIFLDLQEAENIDDEVFVSLVKKSMYINIGKEKFAHDLLLKNSLDSIITITLGDRGSRYYFNGTFADVDICEEICAIDTTGAGDAFFAYVSSEIIRFNLQGMTPDLFTTLKDANKFAAKNIGFIGPNSNLFVIA